MKAKFITADGLVAFDDVEKPNPTIIRAILIDNSSRPWPKNIDMMATIAATNREYRLVSRTESEVVYEEVVRLRNVGRKK